MKTTLQLLGALTMVAALPAAFAQPVGAPPPGNEPTFLFRSMTNGEQTVGYVASGMRIEGGLVKNSPYSAQAVTETTQTLSDGNRISRKTTASLARDSEGRTRREETMGMGPVINGEPVQNIFINDPVAGTSVVLDPRNKVARSMPQMKMPPLPPVLPRRGRKRNVRAVRHDCVGKDGPRHGDTGKARRGSKHADRSGIGNSKLQP